MNSVVRLVVSALWTVAYVLVDAVADYSSTPVLNPALTGAPRAVAATPSQGRTHDWLARRLLSPPAFLD